MVRPTRLVAYRGEAHADLETPVSAFLKLRPLGAMFLLESVEHGETVGRYSFIGLDPHARWTLKDRAVHCTRNGVASVAAVPPGKDPLHSIQDLLAAHRVVREEEGLPRLLGGAVGFLGYDIARWFERLPATARRDRDLPDADFFLTGTLVIFDHLQRSLRVFSLGEGRRGAAAAQARIARILDALAQPLPAGIGQAVPRSPRPRSNVSRREFERRVRRVLEHIRAGDCFQAVLSQRFRGRTQAGPFHVYRALRRINPSPYMFFLDFGDYQLIGSSPEALVQMENGMALVRPIAGTRPRGRDEGEDRRLEAELLADAKERAEHVMLVDLGRNDLGRVCRYGTVRPTQLFAVERYSHVMHLVSRVVGRLREDVDMFGLLRAR